MSSILGSPSAQLLRRFPSFSRPVRNQANCAVLQKGFGIAGVDAIAQTLTTNTNVWYAQACAKRRLVET